MFSEEHKRNISLAKIGKPNKKCSETKKKLYSEGKLKIWNKGLKGEKYKKHYPNGMKGLFQEGHTNSIKEKNANWKGGRFKRNDGYILILNPENPFCNKQGYILEHRLIMEKHIGRYLRKDEDIHHINHKKDDNRIENLMILPSNKHMILHRWDKI